MKTFHKYVLVQVKVFGQNKSLRKSNQKNGSLKFQNVSFTQPSASDVKGN